MLRQPLLRALPRVAPRQARAASHGPSYNQPSGYLFGEKIPKGQKRQRESWETIFYVGMGGSVALVTVMFAYRPDTSIQTWALQEAKARMEARGETVEYKPSQP
ncbi:uncharacterized protein EHS24_007755 [Apiotrichum porosum]|uniref:NADH dehydrogenase [ubiquinone] 1 beta subcomplex subunit 11, mitochondrial n=1 Tax=Apiotrichum porosum TaxID=105984 RepID=A0A427XVK3_9TREE|nr:uncharacterized protein EHS24_007755 [Apiotrichum porosum]RSH82761.1 hypothetical protein EHS24_007755 [Apiotrichum porosum]